MVFVPAVVLLQLLYVLCVGGRDNGFDHHGIHHRLEGVLLTFDIVVLLVLEDLSPLGVILNFWVEELGIINSLAVEVVVSGSETHFGLGEHNWEETVLAPPFGGFEMACKGRELLNEVLNGVEGGMPQDCVEWDLFHPPPYHFGDGGHFCRDFRHGCAVLAISGIT